MEEKEEEQEKKTFPNLKFAWSQITIESYY